MNPISRRKFLATSALSIAATRLRGHSQMPDVVTFSIPAAAAGPHMPTDFVGLSYEVKELANPDFFSATNTGLIRALKRISPRGVLRLGGNTSEFGWWKPTSNSPEPEHPKTREVVGEPKANYYAVTPEAIRNLAAFLEATGWTCLYGINMGTNTPDRAADEAEFVAKTLGARLQYFQIGNEVNLFSRHLRDPQTWSAPTYLTEWLTLARAVAARVPGARFGMPDVTDDISWLPQIADAWGSVHNPPYVTTLSHHYYFGGPPSNPDVNVPNLLAPAAMAKVQKMADIANDAAHKMNIRARMTEGNTCYRGGKPGVSDVFAAALWAADYSLHLAANGYSGINLHGGTGSIIASGLGGVMFGDQVLRDQGATLEQIATHPHAYYSPIAQFGSDFVLEPVAYGLMFAGSLVGGALIEAALSLRLQSAGVNATAYVAELPRGQTSVIVLNKDAENDFALRFDFGDGKTGAVEIERLHAPSLESREAHITRSPEPGQLKEGKFTALIPRASGVRITVV